MSDLSRMQAILETRDRHIHHWTRDAKRHGADHIEIVEKCRCGAYTGVLVPIDGMDPDSVYLQMAIEKEERS